jgi:hypothetical protein
MVPRMKLASSSSTVVTLIWLWSMQELYSVPFGSPFLNETDHWSYSDNDDDSSWIHRHSLSDVSSSMTIQRIYFGTVHFDIPIHIDECTWPWIYDSRWWML